MIGALNGDDAAPLTGRPPSRFASLSRRHALVVLGALLLLFAWFFYGTTMPSSVRIAAKPGQKTDVDLYKAIIGRVHDGQNYYDAVGTELRARNYPVKPIFNWRQPTYAFLLAHLPSMKWASGILIVVGSLFVTLCLVRFGMRTAGGAAAAVTLALVPPALYFQETWAGFFIALGLCFYAYQRWRLGMAALLVALAFREFALLPCAVALAVAWHEGRRAEVRAWIAALLLYGALLAVHATLAARHFLPTDIPRSWFSMGGSGFLIASAVSVPLLAFLPKWAVALVFPLALFGLAGWRGPAGTRIALTMAGYALVFSIIGLRMNSYWGLIYAPLLSLGIARAPQCLRDLYRSLRPASIRSSSSFVPSRQDASS